MLLPILKSWGAAECCTFLLGSEWWFGVGGCANVRGKMSDLGSFWSTELVVWVQRRVVLRDNEQNATKLLQAKLAQIYEQMGMLSKEVLSWNLKKEILKWLRVFGFVFWGFFLHTWVIHGFLELFCLYKLLSVSRRFPLFFKRFSSALKRVLKGKHLL